MAKPIIVLEVPLGTNIDGWIPQFEKNMPDYHVILFDGTSDRLKMQVFYEKDMTEIRFDDLKKELRELINEKDSTTL